MGTLYPLSTRHVYKISDKNHIYFAPVLLILSDNYDNPNTNASVGTNG